MHFSTALRFNFGRHIVSDAQKLLGRSHPYSNLQSILNSDVASLALGVRKLFGSRHPLPETMKFFLKNGHELLQTFSAVILLLSDVCRHPSTNGGQRADRILDSQRSLADISEIIYAANFIHMSVMARLPAISDSDRPLLSYGNKMAVLGGDYLLANACVALASIGKPSVIAAVSTAISDMSLAALRRSAIYHVRSPSFWLFKDPNEWRQQATLSIASLLAHCCSASADLANAGVEMQKSCFDYAKNAALLITLQLGSRLGKIMDQTDDSDNQVNVPYLVTDEREMSNLRAKLSSEALLAINELPAGDSAESLKKFATSLT